MNKGINMNKIILVGSLLLTLFSAAGQTAGQDNRASDKSVVGVWESHETGSKLVFHEDGTVDFELKARPSADGSRSSGVLAFTATWEQDGDSVIFGRQDAALADLKVETIDSEEVLTDGIANYYRKGSAFRYERKEVHPVTGRQGVCTEDGYYWVSGSGSLAKYDSSWNKVAENTEPFEGYTLEVNHIGDIDVYNNELYLGVEYFMDGAGKNIQVAVYDGDTLTLKRVFPFRSDTGQMECSGIAVDSDSRTVYMTSWIDDESSEYLYRYDLDTGDYKGRLKMRPAPEWIQGIACLDGNLYITSDDGDADENAPDHMYRVEIADDKMNGYVIPEKTFDDVTRQGEIEGLSFDEEGRQFLLLYNRGAKIVAGMPTGFYDGYSEEIHEVFVYDIRPFS